MTDAAPLDGPPAAPAPPADALGGRRQGRRRPPVRRLGPWLAETALRAVRAASGISDRTLPGWFPLAGDVLGSPWTDRRLAASSTFGRSAINPAIVEIDLDPSRNRGRPKALGKVASRVFGSCPRFVVNVGFACGDAGAFSEGDYTRPGSAWFNVFSGYYQIDVAVDAWERPFGYQPSDGGFTIDPAELAQLGQADWNYFSNYLYGVPLSAIASRLVEAVTLTSNGRIPVGGRWWDQLSGSGIPVSSAYVAPADGGFLRGTGRPLTELWRASFGQPYTAAESDPPDSFFVTEISPEMLVCFDRVCDPRDFKQEVYRTFVLGGVVNDWWAEQDPGPRSVANTAFLAHQLKILTEIARTTFSGQGFDDPGELTSGGQPLVVRGTAPAVPPFSL